MEDNSLPTGTVTFLFTDIEGSTKLLRQLGPAYPALLEQHSAIVRGGIVAHGGRVVSTEGDSFFAVFRSAASAAAAAVDILKKLAAAPPVDGNRVAVRMGLHTGEGVLGGDNYAGLDVNRAARVAAAAHGEQVVATSTTAALVASALPEAVTLKDLGQHRLKDLPNPEHLYQLVVPGVRSEFPTLRSVDSRPNNLPVQLTSFVGRAALIDELIEVVRRSRLVTLTGPGGTGKTRLSLEAAGRMLREFADGVFFVALAPITNPALVIPTIANVLGLQERGTAGIAATLAEHLSSKRMLLVLDNFEQLLPAAPDISWLLKIAPGSRALVSSRAVLHLSGEMEFPVPPLNVPSGIELPAPEALSQYEAVALFIERASEVKPGFTVTNANAPAVAAICERLDGLPLAIELAAARVRLLPPQAIMRRLEGSLSFLTGGSVDLPARQRTLRNAIAWSYDLLDDSEQQLFRSLSVFRGGWSLDRAEGAWASAGDADIVDLLASLADKSLIRSSETPAGEPRFTMLETIREFGYEMATAAGEDSDLRARHAGVYLAMAEQAFADGEGDQVEWLDRLDLEHDNIRAALRFYLESADIRSGLRLAAAIWRFWHLRGHLAEGRRWLEELLAVPKAKDDSAVRAAALYAVASLAYWQEDYGRADSCYREARGIYDRLGDPKGLADVLLSLGFVSTALGRPAKEGMEYYRQSRDFARSLGDRKREAWARMGLAMTNSLLKEYAPAVREAESALDFVRSTSDKFALASLLTLIGQIRRDMGDVEKALPPLKEGAELFAELGDLSGLTSVLDDLSVIATQKDDHREAVTFYAASASFKERIGGAAPIAIVRTPDPRPEAAKRLSATEIDEAWRRGASMSPEEATAYILKELQGI